MTDWERCKPWIEAALPYAGGTHTIEDIEAAIKSQKMALLSGVGCALVIETHVYPRLKSLHVFLAGGNLAEIKAFDRQLIEIAHALGCSRITLAGRGGFVRALSDLGYVPKWTVLSKELRQ